MDVSWVWGLVGGLIIGLAGAVLLLGNGRIMGASGILGSLLDGTAGHARFERLIFLFGLVGVPALIMAAGADASTHATHNALLLLLGGLAVGLGTRIANGCTSGHGVCGISRLSLRGIVATMFYMGVGIVTVTIVRVIWGV